jgi:hypothetical protein
VQAPQDPGRSDRVEGGERKDEERKDEELAVSIPELRLRLLVGEKTAKSACQNVTTLGKVLEKLRSTMVQKMSLPSADEFDYLPREKTDPTVWDPLVHFPSLTKMVAAGQDAVTHIADSRSATPG